MKFIYIKPFYDYYLSWAPISYSDVCLPHDRMTKTMHLNIGYRGDYLQPTLGVAPCEIKKNNVYSCGNAPADVLEREIGFLILPHNYKSLILVNLAYGV